MNRKSIKGQKLSPRKLENECLKVFWRQPAKRLNAKQIIKKLGIKNNKTSVEDALTKLESRGKIKLVKADKYKLAKKIETHSEDLPEVIEGYVDQIRSGAAYVIPDDKSRQDIYVPARRLNTALNGDRVRVKIRGRYRGKKEGEVVKVVKRGTEQFIGNLQESTKYAFVVPDNRMIEFDIYVHPKDMGPAQDGDKVLIKVLEWPKTKQMNPIGEIVKVLDPTDTHSVMMDSILINHGFDTLFGPVVLQETKQLSRVITSDEIALRKDMRNKTTLTIDPLTARDFDDAISYHKLDNGNLEIGIHIADVTHYVKPGSAIDREALRRSTSVYLVDRVAPMLPEVLSNELCSLRPDEDSLTFSTIFEFDEKMNIVKRWFGKTIIHSDKRFTYEEAQETIEASKGPFAEELEQLNMIAHHLRQKRYKDGSITFDTPELQFELDENNHPIAIRQKERKDAHLLVEDFMLLANREVATFIHKKNEREIPFVYRVHDLPNEEKLADYSLFLKELGFLFDFQSPTQIRKSFDKLSKAAKTNESLAFAEQFAVRTMAKAEYTTDNIGHFGLGFDFYSHFTSPIRRYADVLVHRILEKNLEGEFRSGKEDLEAQCKHINNQEKKAQEAERDSIKYKQVEFIASHVGEEFDGIVSGVIDRGFFVALKESGVEGLVPFDDLNEAFVISETKMKAIAKRSDRIFKMGDTVRVRIVDARINDLEVDLKLVED